MCVQLAKKKLERRQVNVQSLGFQTALFCFAGFVFLMALTNIFVNIPFQ